MPWIDTRGNFQEASARGFVLPGHWHAGPKLLILDEPLSSLDLTIQAKLLDLFEQLKEKFRLTYIFISHNLAVIRYIADKVMVMKDGRVVEYADRQTLFERPVNEYTRQLLEAAK